jgi:hypothetical protein
VVRLLVLADLEDLEDLLEGKVIQYPDRIRKYKNLAG